MQTAFHLAIGVDNLEKAKAFYVDLLGAKPTRSSNSWADFNVFGHQLSCHLVDEIESFSCCNQVDGKSVPIPHFGLIVQNDFFENLKKSLEQAKTHFILKPQIRFKDKPEEQKTMFFKDPFGNCIEIKSFTHSKGFD